MYFLEPWNLIEVKIEEVRIVYIAAVIHSQGVFGEETVGENSIPDRSVVLTLGSYKVRL